MQLIRENTAKCYDKEFSTSAPRRKPSVLKATALTHYRFIDRGCHRVSTGSLKWDYYTTPTTLAEQAMGDTRLAYPASLVSNKLLAKIKNQTWSAVVDLAELPETLRFLYDSVRSMYRIYRDIKRGKFRDSLGKKNLDDLAAMWMAWRYAVMPIVYSIQDAVKMYQEPVEIVGKPLIAKTHVPISKRWSPNGDPTSPQWSCNGKLRGLVAYRVTGSRTAMRLGFSLAELPVVIWEVTPLSFVVDWILPIGDALAGISATNNVEFLDGYTSQRFKGSCEWADKVEINTPTQHAVSYRSEPASQAMIDYYSRTPLTGFPTPSLALDPNMNWKRWVDALALLKLIILRNMR